MQRRRLGGLEVSAVGLGCATMTPFYDEPDRDAAIETLRRAREIGVDFLDSSDAYGRGRNEELIARGVEGHRDEYVIASKFGNLRAPDGSPTSDGRPLCCTDQHPGAVRPRSDIYVRRTYFGRPSSSIRFSEATAMATSVICRPLVRERSASPSRSFGQVKS